MADGHTHTRMTLLHGAYFSAVLYLCDFNAVPAFAAGFVYQVFASPDRDLNGGSIGEFYLRKYTWFLDHYWKLLWYPYGIAMKHRGKSHALYGTAVRFLYLLSPFIMLTSLRDGESPGISRCLASQLMCLPIQIAIGFGIATWGIGALCLFMTSVLISDLIHLVFDGYWYKHIDL